MHTNTMTRAERKGRKSAARRRGFYLKPFIETSPAVLSRRHQNQAEQLNKRQCREAAWAVKNAACQRRGR